MKLYISIILMLLIHDSLSAQKILYEYNANTSLGFANKLYYESNSKRIYFKSNFNWEEQILCFEDDLSLNWHTSIGDRTTYDQDPQKTLPLIKGELIINENNIDYYGLRIHSIFFPIGILIYKVNMDANGNVLDDTLFYTDDDYSIDKEINQGNIKHFSNNLYLYGYKRTDSYLAVCMIEKIAPDGVTVTARATLDTIYPLEYEIISDFERIDDNLYIAAGRFYDIENDNYGIYTVNLDSNLNIIKRTPMFKGQNFYNTPLIAFNQDTLALILKQRNWENRLGETTEFRAFITFTDLNGDIISTSNYLIDYYTFAEGITSFANGFLIYGSTGKPDENKGFAENDSTRQCFLTRIDKKGNVIWEKIWGKENAADQINICTITDENKIIVAGESDYKTFLAILEDDSITNVAEAISSNLLISPNPADSKIRIDADDIGKIDELMIFDALGNELMLLRNFDPMQEIDLTGFASGMYFLRIYSAGGYINSKFVKR